MTEIEKPKKKTTTAKKKEMPKEETKTAEPVQAQEGAILPSKKHAFLPTDPCPCCSGKQLGECCALYFEGKAFAPTPEALIRARYCAHVTHNHKFLIDSTHPQFRDNETEEGIIEWADQVKWDGITILTSIAGKSGDTSGSIAFVVRFIVGGIPREMKETAHFVKEDGKWYYTDGDVEGHITYKRGAPKTGRNDACPCGSGKKYKKCCLEV